MSNLLMTNFKARSAQLLGLGLLANGVAMLATPDDWYQFIPGVTLSGPLNSHFVRDVGCAYVLSGVGMLAAGRDSTSSLLHARWAAGFLSLHALVHLYELAVNICGMQTWLTSVPGVTAPAFIAVWIAWPRRSTSARLNATGA